MGGDAGPALFAGLDVRWRSRTNDRESKARYPGGGHDPTYKAQRTCLRILPDARCAVAKNPAGLDRRFTDECVLTTIPDMLRGVNFRKPFTFENVSKMRFRFTRIRSHDRLIVDENRRGQKSACARIKFSIQ